MGACLIYRWQECRRLSNQAALLIKHFPPGTSVVPGGKTIGRVNYLGRKIASGLELSFNVKNGIVDMQMEIIRKHFHADVTVAIQITVNPDMPVHVITGMLHEVMKLEFRRTAAHCVARAGESRTCKKYGCQHRDN
jgi:hypothetical protein